MDRIYRVRNGVGGRYVVERDNALHWLDGDVFGDYRAGAGIDEPLKDFLAPVMPSKIMAIGLNYKDHAAEMKKALPAEPLLFIKPPTTVIGPEAAIQIPSWPGRIEHEAEMAVVIGRRASRVKARDAMDYILGVTCLCDVTARELQAKDVQVLARQGLRHVRAARAVHRRRPRPVRARGRRLGQRAEAAALEHPRADLPGARGGGVADALLHAGTRRRHHHRHALGRRTAGAR